MASAHAIDRRPLHIEVADRLRELITQGEIGPGERLNERALIERFGISRTPLREAVKILSAEGLVKLFPNRGAVVVTITSTDVDDMFQVLSSLEALGGELACKRATDAEIAEIAELYEQMQAHHAAGQVGEYFDCKQRMHQLIIDCARNRELAQAYRRISLRIRCPRFNSNCSAPRWNEVMDENKQILDALVARDGRRLARQLQDEVVSRSQIIQKWLAAREAQVKSAT